MRSEVQIFPDPPVLKSCTSTNVEHAFLFYGAIAQLGERLLCKQEVGGSIPPGSTINFDFAVACDFFKAIILSVLIILFFNNLEISDVLSGSTIC